MNLTNIDNTKNHSLKLKLESVFYDQILSENMETKNRPYDGLRSGAPKSSSVEEFLGVIRKSFADLSSKSSRRKRIKLTQLILQIEQKTGIPTVDIEDTYNKLIKEEVIGISSFLSH